MENPTPETGENKTNRFILLASVLVVLLILAGVAGRYAWYHWYNACDTQAVEQASTSLRVQVDMLDQVAQSASNAFRTDLTYPVSVMQQTYMNTQEVDVPVCLQTAKTELLSYMEGVIGAFEAYAASKSDATVIGLLKQSDQHYKIYYTELKAIQKCAPYCAPWD